MSTNEITIHVSPEIASAYRLGSEEDRHKMELLASLHLLRYLRSSDSLQEAMAAMSRRPFETA